MTAQFCIRRALPLIVFMLLAACGGTADDASGAGGDRVTLTGAGATFPFPVYARWFDAYGRENPVRVNYQSIGSGGGIRQFIEGTVDFGASDAPMSDEEMARAAGGVLNLPTVLGAVAVTYNLPEIEEPLRLDGALVADIFLGNVTRWDDPRLTELNPGVQLPSRPILVVHRSDGSGTTYVFADYLSAVSPEWTERVGLGTAVRWPTGIGGKGNEGVTGQVRQTAGAIGYVEQVYARQNDMPMAAIRNRAGAFVEPSIEATTASAAGVDDRLQEQGDFRISLVDAPQPDAYPISSWTYLLVNPHMQDCGKARALLNVFRWALEDGDGHARELHYAPLPESVKEGVRVALDGVTCGADRQPASGGGAQ